MLHISSQPDKKNNFNRFQTKGKSFTSSMMQENIVWKKNLSRKNNRQFHIVDAYRNGQQQILFNTASLLYLVDLTATIMELIRSGFRQQLPTPVR